VLWAGQVIDPEDNHQDTVAVRELNELMATDERITVSMVPIADGVTLARKR
jgi:caffeoyl-CoA O-methyltransferase